MIRWYSTLKGDNGLLNFITPTKDSLIVCHQGPEFRKFSLFNYHYLFGKYFLKQPAVERCFYEVIQGQYPQKPYFDIDIDCESEGSIIITEEQSMTLIRDLKKSILEDSRISESDILVFSSHGKTQGTCGSKLSYHIVVDRWCLSDYSSNKIYCNKIIERTINPYKKYIDSLVYKSIQQFRTYGSTKRSKDRTKILVGNSGVQSRFEFLTTLLRSFVSNTNSCRILEYSEPIKRVFSGPSEALTDEEMEIVKSLPLMQSGDFEILDVKDRLISLKRLKSSYCEICKREHQAENPYLIVTRAKASSEFQIHFHCRRTKDDKLVVWESEGRAEGRAEDRAEGQGEAVVQSLTDVQTSETVTPDRVKTKAFIKKFLGK